MIGFKNEEGVMLMNGAFIPNSNYASEMAEFYDNKTVMKKDTDQYGVPMYPDPPPPPYKRRDLNLKPIRSGKWKAAFEMLEMAEGYHLEGNHHGAEVGLDAALRMIEKLKGDVTAYKRSGPLGSKS